MVATAADNRAELLCTCRLVLEVDGDERRVKARSWDCPSCGRDKRNTLATMVSAALAERLITFTLPQPHAVDEDGCPVTPDGFGDCDWATHVYRYRDGSLRWRTLSTCSHCCARVSRMMRLQLKRARRQWPQAQVLWAREDHKSGSVHVHSAWVGLPAMGRRSRAGRRFKRWWSELGGGFVDLGAGGDSPRDARRVGWYIGKYLAKRHDQKMAPGYRRWSRSYGFAPEVRMPRWVPEDGHVPAVTVRILGWEDPRTGEVCAERFWPPEPRPTAHGSGSGG